MMKFLAKLWKFLRLPKNTQLSIMRLIQDQFLIGVTGVIFNDHDEILLFRHSYRQRPWSLPGGYLKRGEHPKEGLTREIEEESGYTVNIEDRLRIRTDRDAARLDIVYTGKYIGGTFTPSAEVTEGKFYTFDELPDISKKELLLINAAYKKRIYGKRSTPNGNMLG